MFGRFRLLNQDTSIARMVSGLGGVLFIVPLVRGYLAVTCPEPAAEVDDVGNTR